MGNEVGALDYRELINQSAKPALASPSRLIALILSDREFSDRADTTSVIPTIVMKPATRLCRTRVPNSG
jgi:hypothetical protein